MRRSCRGQTRLLPNPRATEPLLDGRKGRRALTAQRLCALLLILAGFSEPLWAQGQQDPARDAARAEELKRGIDRALARVLRDLRTELHRAVDDAFRGGESLEDLLLELDQLSLRAAPASGSALPRQPAPTAAERLAAIDREMHRLGSVPARTPGKGVKPDTSEILPQSADWTDLGMTLETASQILNPKEGQPVVLKVASVARGSVAQDAGIRMGDRLEFAPCKDLAVGRLQPSRVIKGLRFPSGESKGQAIVLEVPDGPTLEAARMVRSLFDRAIDEIVPKNGVLTPPSGGATLPGQTP